MLRKHQREFAEVTDGIIAGSPITDIIVMATPGAGKSSLPIIAGKLITAGLADKICWIAPRMSLQDQAERNFIDPFFRQMFNHTLTIRSSTNENNPSRGTHGFVTTYQALGVDKFSTVLQDFHRYRYILILDEYHHAEEEGEWTQALTPLYKAAAYRVLMTGTLARGDKKKIAFTPYRENGDEFVPVLEGSETTAVIEYTRQDALADRAIIPLAFKFSDGRAKWEVDGEVERAKISTTDKKKTTAALYTAINTEYAYQLMDACIAHWRKHKATRPGAKLLIVAAKIDNAKQYLLHAQRAGLTARIATSEDNDGAVAAIKELKAGRIDALVAVAMVYEGLDVPAVSHIACLTNIRSTPWIMQMAARAVRIDPMAGPYDTQRAYVFAPADMMFREIAEEIETDQVAVAAKRNAAEKGEGGATPKGETGDLFGFGPAIRPLESSIIAAGPEPVPLFPAGDVVNVLPTNSEMEADLLAKIESHIRTYSFQNRYNPKKINGEVFASFGKARRDMTIKELGECLEYVQRNYPLSYRRGTGKRVPTKARPFPTEWRAAAPF